MTLRNEDLIVRYFDRNMSVSEEQNFLISLAASDELRIAFRSHLELNRAIRQDKDDMRPVAQVRSRTLATLGLTAAATLPFLEQALVQSSDPVRAATTHVIPAQVTAPTVEQSSWISTLIRSTSGRFAALTSGLLLGFSSALVFMNIGTSGLPQNTRLTNPATVAPSITAPSTEQQVTIQANQLQSASSQTHDVIATEQNGLAVKQSDAKPIKTNRGSAPLSINSHKVSDGAIKRSSVDPTPEVNTNGSAPMLVMPTIKRPPVDSTPSN
jgi:hypothetical protein